jgi:hypothetical protein
MNITRFIRYVIPLLALGVVLTFFPQHAQGSSLGIDTSNFNALFGDGNLVRTGETEVPGSVGATVGYAVWQGNEHIVFVYDLHVHSCGKGCSEASSVVQFRAGRSDQTPISWTSPNPGMVQALGTVPGLGYVTDDPGRAPASAYLTSGSGGTVVFPWSPSIKTGGESTRFFAVFDAAVVEDGMSNGQITALVGVSPTLFSIAAPVPRTDANPTPVPEPTSLLLLGSGIVGLGYLRRKQSRARLDTLVQK